jgi:hypothetical protein
MNFLETSITAREDAVEESGRQISGQEQAEGFEG